MNDDDKLVNRALALTAVGADVVSGGGLSILTAGRQALGIETAAERCTRAVVLDTQEWLEERVQDLESGFVKLQEEVKGARPTDVRPIVDGLAKALRTTADPEKRKLLEAAARNAFDPDLYRAGMTVTLLEKMERLSYGEVTLLRELAIERTITNPEGLVRLPALRPPGSLRHVLATRLIRESLLRYQHLVEDSSWILLSSEGNGVAVTDLGRMLLDLLTEPAT